MRNRWWKLAGGLGFAFFLTAGSCVAGSQAPEEKKHAWHAFRPLVGTWKGEGAGFGGPSDVTHRWSFVLGGQFLELRTQSVQRRADGSAEVHEDVGYLSHDKDHGAFVFRRGRVRHGPGPGSPGKGIIPLPDDAPIEGSLRIPR